MSSYSNLSDAMAFIMEDENVAKSELISRIRAGISSWRDIEADIFTYHGKTLVLARQLPPKLHRVGEGSIRLRRLL